MSTSASQVSPATSNNFSRARDLFLRGLSTSLKDPDNWFGFFGRNIDSGLASGAGEALTGG